MPNEACHPSGHYWDYYGSTQSSNQVSVINLKFEYLKMKSMGAQTSNELET